ncbi:glycosyltransferase [Glutamicibacter mishrai]|uniref:Glycosyltransferase n=1 Tax=Glutamicibacter mishrai TaxID=1775880 RepID=A0A6H0SLM9_9MICC|nr:glycosyltransferase [Glutamicibacter mishrai]QIV88363.1 glycosyltransferase [Glutamicibacter mishrai]
MSRRSFMITWIIDEKFGGLTTACLQRASSFAKKYGKSNVVTFAYTQHLNSTVERLRGIGLIASGVKVHNLYSDYASRVSHPPVKKLAVKAEGMKWSVEPVESQVNDAGIFKHVYAHTDDSASSRIIYSRPDGSKFMSDAKFVADGESKREIAIFNGAGEVLKKFSSASSLYRHWLTEIVGYEESIAVFDSSFVASMMGPWRAPKTTKMFVFHSSHVVAGAEPETGPVVPKHQKIAANADNWDVFVFLTRQQADDFNARFGHESKSVVIPNIIKSSSLKKFSRRNDPRQIISVGSLDSRKQVDHAIRAVHELKELGVDCKLAIVGKGQKQHELQSLAKELGLSDRIEFAGHVDDVPRRLANSGILLFTSKLEGQGLVLLEAQFHGCVPISYDVRYGPASVIDSGVNGMLVGPNDIHALSSHVASLIDNPKEYKRLSKQAHSSAKRYARQDLTNLWIKAAKNAR